ncbi:MAG TPA: amino acid adenylation domain-containing protein, partial [Candidatus Dormibacteraeota bacterium]|nr:amino acid adenylation domain-containing protein [Candidatus Dormibacteraeota bacterium]
MKEASTTFSEKTTATIVDVLRFRATTQKNDIAYRFLANGEEESATLTYGELDRRARQIAAELQRISAEGQRALLLDSSELDYIITFCGCLCAGVIAVPIYAPRLNKKGNARIESVVADAQPSVVLTAGSGSPAGRDLVTASVGEHVKWIDTNALPNRGDLWIPPALSGADTAFLQYTSGSTANPKGVMVSHANILHNEEMIQKAFGTGPGSTIVGWLPLYHDMGLIGTVLQPLFAGVPCILMSPVAFLQRPLRWLQAIARYQATTSGGPNFAYELCMRKIRPEDRCGLDLSSWRVAFNGAEPVRLETLNRFAAQFAGCGFRREAFVPCYGLAEGTLFVSGGLEPNGVTAVHHGANGGPTNGAKTSRQGEKMLVSCGRPPAQQEVRILSPDSLQPCFDGQVGEIWIKGPSVAQGYWRKPEETEETFNAQIPGTAEGPFLRTGDLGFLSDGHLFITGRLKDLLIIRGQNYYPQDIELTVEQSHTVLQPGSGAAFSVEIEGEERLVVVQEAAVAKNQEAATRKDNDDFDALIKLISRNIVSHHELQPYAVVLIRKGTIPKTSSSKIQRHACRAAFLNKELHVLREWREKKQPQAIEPESSISELRGLVPYGLASWVASEIALVKGMDHERVDLNQPFAAYGFDSLAAIEFAHKLQTEFHVDVELSEFFGESSITEVMRRATKSTSSSVSKVESKKAATFPLSYGQRALWFVNRLAPDSSAYNICRIYRIRSSVDVEVLRDCFQVLVDRHPSLRTTINEVAGEPVQQVAEKVRVCFEYFDTSNWSDTELDIKLDEQNHRLFSLTQGPLFRVGVYTRSPTNHLLHVAVHHIVADYWSLTLLLNEIGQLYQASYLKVEAQLAPLEYSYADFVEWQRKKLSGPDAKRLWDYWKDELSGELSPLSLPADHARPPVQTFRGSSLPFRLNAKLTERLKKLGGEQQATLFATLLAAFQVLLFRLSSQTQIIVGCPVAGRSRHEFANTVGYFVNTVPLPADFRQRKTFLQLLSQVRNQVSKAFAHDLYPFPLMVEQLGVARDPAVSPIFQSMFVFQQTYGSRPEDFVRLALGQPQARLTLGGLDLEHVSIVQRTAQFDLTLTVGEGPDGIIGAWEYSSDLFDHSTIVRWSENFKVLLQAVAQYSDCHVSRLPMLSAKQRKHIVEEFNHTQLNYDRQQFVHEEISRQAMSTPDRISVVFGAIELSYQQLEQRSNQVAHYLRKLGVGPDVRVGVCLDRSVELVVFLLGVLKAGGAYVPLDPRYPADRLQYMAQDAQAPVVIVQKQQIELFVNLGVRLICGEEQQAEIERESVADVGVRLEDYNLAYVIYTSGSTGKPKGAMNTHQGLQNRLQWMQEKYQLTSDDRVLQKTPFGFDVSVWEFFWPLMVGARLVMAEPGRHQDPEYLGQTIEQQKVTTLHFVPSMLQAFLESGEVKRCGKLRRIICSGEALSAELAQKCVEQIPAELHNLYGPTEAAIDVTYWPCRREELAQGVAIGKPIANIQMYVLDAEYEPVPVGVEGEIYIAGAGLARGYWNRPDLTAERFIANPLSAEGGARMYQTGDRGRWRRDGNLEYLGRFDHQVKLRGFRIELGEIETCLSKFEGVTETVVVVREDASGDKRLVAYYTTAEASSDRRTQSLGAEQLRQYLAEKVPEYMVPTAFVRLESFPLTPNGKLNRNALPAPDGEAYAKRRYEAPIGEIETTVVGIWAELLKIGRIGRNDNFYALGGHSLLATQVMSRIRQVFEVEVPLRSFLEDATVAGLALQVKKATRIALPPLRPVDRGRRLRLSFAQERLWFLSRYEAQASIYNVPVALRLRGYLNEEAIHASLREIVARHEVLRTSYRDIDGVATQNIVSLIDLSLPVIELTEAEMPEFLRQQARVPFDLASGPVIHALLLRLGSQDHVLLVVLHHIACDGWSLGIMLQELTELYGAFSQGAASPLLPLPVQYADFAEWQREWLQGELLEKQTAYWKLQLGGVEPLDLPTDRPHSAKPTFSGATEKALLPQTLAGRLESFSRQQGVTLFMTLLAAFKILLHRYTGQTDITVGSPIANRTTRELEQLIGFFVNTLVLRTVVAEDGSVAELLRQVREVSLQAYAHQDVPFERLVEILEPARDLSRTPLFQTMFVLQNTPLPKLPWNEVEANPWVLETGTSKFDLSLSAREEDGELELSLEYSTELFGADRMKRLLQHYRILLEGIVASVDSQISEIEMLSEAERQQLLVKWNLTESTYPLDKCVHELFEEQVARTPRAVAVVDEDRQLSYEELNRRANQLAHYLRKMGVGPEVKVGVCVERDLGMVVVLMGILKAGGAYVPLDSTYPAARLNFTLQGAGASVALTERRFKQQMEWFAGRLLDLEEVREEIEKQNSENPKVEMDAENLAWVIYTSGSTGQPKGAAIRHSSAMSLIHWAREVFTREDLSGVLASTSICFDLSTFELFVPLSWGGTVVIAENALQLPSLRRAASVRLLNTVPSAMAELVRMGAVPAEIRTVNLAGEALQQGLVDAIYQRTTVRRVFNLYGPSEDTTYSTYAAVGRGGTGGVTIGRPVSNTQAYVLDGHMQPVPVGVPGELYLGGAGQARGYLNRPELTSEKFVPNPFSRVGGERLYRTGDIVHYQLDGSLEFLGRHDYQVKVRGYRIELGEIEAALLNHPGVAQAVVVAREDQLGGKQLVGYVVGREEEEKLDVGQLRTYLHQRLPEYMMPWALLRLECLPLTPNGKVDRKTLPAPDSGYEAQNNYVGPRGAEEEMLAGIFAKVLRQERVGIEDNFFELGGHSLLATQVVSRVRSVLGVELPLRQIFESPTVRGLAEQVKRARGVEAVAGPRIKPVSRDRDLPLSLQQEQLWFLEQIAVGSTAYSLPGAVRLKGDLDKRALRLSLEEIVRRHEILRTGFVQVDAKPKQRIHETG